MNKIKMNSKCDTDEDASWGGETPKSVIRDS